MRRRNKNGSNVTPVDMKNGYLEQGIRLQKRFLDHFLKDVDNGWNKEPPVQLNLREPFSSEFKRRSEEAWPLPDTKWTKLYLGASDSDLALSWEETPPPSSSSVAYSAWDETITFFTPPLPRPCELTGPLAAKVFISSTTSDADLFVTVQAFAPDGREVDFQGTVDPHTPLAQGSLRASHRKLDQSKSLPYRPYHSHDEIQPLIPGKVYELVIEIWPTNILLPAGYRLALHIGGKDFERPTPEGLNEAWPAKGSGPWLHTHEQDRPKEVFGGVTTIYTGGETDSHLLVPVIDRG